MFHQVLCLAFLISFVYTEPTDDEPETGKGLFRKDSDRKCYCGSLYLPDYIEEGRDNIFERKFRVLKDDVNTYDKYKFKKYHKKCTCYKIKDIEGREMAKDYVDGREMAKDYVDGREMAKDYVDGRKMVKDYVGGRQMTKDYVDGRELVKDYADGREMAKDYPDEREMVKDYVDGRQMAKDHVDGREMAKDYVYGRNMVKDYIDGRKMGKDYVDGLQIDKYQVSTSGPFDYSKNSERIYTRRYKRESEIDKSHGLKMNLEEVKDGNVADIVMRESEQVFDIINKNKSAQVLEKIGYGLGVASEVVEKVGERVGSTIGGKMAQSVLNQVSFGLGLASETAKSIAETKRSSQRKRRSIETTDHASTEINNIFKKFMNPINK